MTHGTETPNEEEDRTIAQVIDGKAFAATLCEGITHYILRLKEKHGITPDLAVVLVGENPASQVYVSSKGKQTVKAGINQLNTDPAVHGTLPEPNGLIA